MAFPQTPVSLRQTGPQISFWLVLILACTVSRSAVGQGNSKIYWSDRRANTVRRSNLDGSEVEVLVSGLREIRGVALDLEHHRLYWADNGTNKIQRSLLDGSQVEDLVTEGLGFPAGIAVDSAAGKMYWADSNTGKIQRADVTGDNVEDLVTGLSNPYYVSLDLEQQQVYWTDWGSDKIQRSNLDGTNVVDLITTGISLPRGIDLDLANQMMYWTDRQFDVVQRSNLDGTNVETLHNASPSSAAPHGIALDHQAGHMYWVDNGLVTLKRADLDGSNVVTILDGDSNELERPWQIVLDVRKPGGDTTVLDDLTRAIRDNTFDATWDVNNDTQLDQADRDFLIQFVWNTGLGDSNLDGQFDSQDLVTVFTAGEYEDAIAQNSTWSSGDWNGDGDFGSSDLVAALSQNRYDTGTMQPIAVPEPTTLALAAIGLGTLIARHRLRR